MNCKLDSDSFSWLVGGKENISVISGIIGETDVHSILSGSLWWGAQLPAFSGSTLVTTKKYFRKFEVAKIFFLCYGVCSVRILAISASFRGPCDVFFSPRPSSPIYLLSAVGKAQKAKGRQHIPLLFSYMDVRRRGGGCLQKKICAIVSLAAKHLTTKCLIFFQMFMPPYKYTVASCCDTKASGWSNFLTVKAIERMICTLVDFGGKRTQFQCMFAGKTPFIWWIQRRLSLFFVLLLLLLPGNWLQQREALSPPFPPRMIPGAADVKKEKGREEGNCHLIPI